MALILVTGVPGTGKTAFIVSEIEKIAATGRTIFVDNIPGLNLEHYRAGKITDWQKGIWLHIDQYKRTAPAISMSNARAPAIEVDDDHDDDDGDGNENWIPHPEVVKDKDGNLHRLALDQDGHVVGSVPYESHKGAAIFIDEAQRHFRPRPVGSPVPDHVAALEVHRHQGLDIYLITQRPGLIDSNVRALCGKHIALRSTPFGRYKYEWPEVGDIDSKSSRDTAAKSRYKLPKHVFKLYKSAEVHTTHKHALPMAAKVLLVALPLAAGLLWNSYQTISGKFRGEGYKDAMASSHQSTGNIKNAALTKPVQSGQPGKYIPVGFEPYHPKEIEGKHPFERQQFSIVGRVQSATKDMYRFSVADNGQHAFYTSTGDLEKAGYTVTPINDCSVKLTYKAIEFFVTCDTQRSAYQPVQFQAPTPHQVPQPGIQFEPYP